MNLKVRYNLWKEKNRISPDPKFKRELLSRLLKNSPQPAQVFHFAFRIAISVAAVVLVVLVGAGAYAYTSPQVTEGHPLYPIKRSLENIEGLTKRTPISQAEFSVKKIERRLAEEKILQDREKEAEAKLETSIASRDQEEESATSTQATDNNIEQEIDSDLQMNDKIDKTEANIEREKNRLEELKVKHNLPSHIRGERNNGRDGADDPEADPEIMPETAD